MSVPTVTLLTDASTVPFGPDIPSRPAVRAPLEA